MRIGPIGIAVLTLGSFVAGQAADDREKQQVRTGASDRIVVRWTADREARAKDHFAVEIPARSDVHLRMKASDLTVSDVDGNKDTRMVAGDLKIEVYLSSLARADASVTFGDLEARSLGMSRRELKRWLDWTGAGPYAVDARLLAGDQPLMHPR